MAIIKCSQCGRETSDRATECMYCGARRIGVKDIKNVLIISTLVMPVIIYIGWMMLAGNILISALITIGIYNLFLYKKMPIIKKNIFIISTLVVPIMMKLIERLL